MRPIAAPRGRLGKFGNRISYDQSGNRFDSKKELARWQELNLLLRAGEIKKLERQVPFVLSVNGIKICVYKADFVFWERVDGGWAQTIEDVKGVRTAVYVLKKKLMLACLGLTITET